MCFEFYHRRCNRENENDPLILALFAMIGVNRNACYVTIIVVESIHGDPSTNLERDC